jgi:hypothetical protein
LFGYRLFVEIWEFSMHNHPTIIQLAVDRNRFVEYRRHQLYPEPR